MENITKEINKGRIDQLQLLKTNFLRQGRFPAQYKAAGGNEEPTKKDQTLWQVEAVKPAKARAHCQKKSKAILLQWPIIHSFLPKSREHSLTQYKESNQSKTKHQAWIVTTQTRQFRISSNARAGLNYPGS